MTLQITKRQARRFLLQKQLLLSPKSLSGKDAINTVFQTLRVIQFDPLNPCGRNTDLVLQSRIRDYHPDDYHKWLYEEKKGIECYDKELCIIPLEDLSLTRYLHTKAEREERVKLFLKKYRKDIELLLKEIAEKGPVSSADIKDTRRVDSGWGVGDALFGRLVLETLWRIGKITVVRRTNGRKYYDLIEKAHGKLSSVDTKRLEAVEKIHILRRLKSVGILPVSGTGSAFQGIGSAKETKGIIRKLIEEKEVLEVSVHGSKQTYMINEADRELVVSPDQIGVSNQPRFDRGQTLAVKRMVFIAPLDTLMWDRNMIEDFFGFYYRWDVYVPARLRKFGYYTLPILYGEEFIGRIEPVFDKKSKQLVIKGLWKERNWNTNEEKAYTEALQTFKNYLNAKEIIVI